MPELDKSKNAPTEDYVLVRTDDVGLIRYELETDDPDRVRDAFERLAPVLSVGHTLDVVKRSTEVLYSAVGVDPSQV